MTTVLPLAEPLTDKLVELFTGPLRDVRFPDADLERLTRAIEEAEAAHRAVVQAELALGAAREALADKREAVTKQCARSLAYARVYAADRPELLATLDDLASPTPAPSRGRRAKTVAAPAAVPDGARPGRGSKRAAETARDHVAEAVDAAE